MAENNLDRADKRQLVEAFTTDDSPSTDAMQAEIQTLESILQKPRPETSSYSNDEECQRIVRLVEKIGATPQTSKEDISPDDDPPYEQIGHYKLLAKLGEGGMGAVYKALHTKLNKLVALKVLPADRLKDEQAVARFEREMRAVGQLSHTNIVAAHDAGEVDGNHYLVMELVDGADLSTLVRRCGPLPLAEACQVIRHAAEGLQYAHISGMVHRDIKPGNLMLTNAGQVKILDMGLALLDEMKGPSKGELTTTGQMMGTLDYMAPEQGTDSHHVDIRADVYSLGATLFKLITGEAPFHGPKYETPVSKMMALAVETPRTLRDVRDDVPPELSDIVARMLTKKPDERPATPREVIDLLAPFAEGAQLHEVARLAEDEVEGEAEAPSADTFAHLRSSYTETLPTVERAPLPEPQVAIPPRKTRRWWIAAAALVPVIIAAVVFSLRTPQGISLHTPQGTIIVEVPEGEEDNVEISVRQGGKVVEVLDADSGWAIQIKEGKYELDVKKGGDRFALENNELTVTRDGKTRVKVQFKPAVAWQDRPTVPDGSESYGLRLNGYGDPPLQSTVVKLTELKPITARAGFRGYQATTNGKGPMIRPDVEVADEYLFAHAPSRISYAVSKGMKSFTAIGYAPCSWTFTFKVMTGNKTLFESDGRWETIRVDLPPNTDVIDLILIRTHPKDPSPAFWVAPRLHPVPAEEVKDLFTKDGDHVSLTRTKRLLAFKKDGEVLVNHPPKNMAPPVVLDNFEQCKEFIYANPESRAEYKIPIGATAFSAVGYSNNGGVQYKVYADKALIYSSTKAGIVPIKVGIPKGASILALEITGWNFRSDSHWCYPRFHISGSKAAAGVVHALEFDESKQTCVEIPTLRFDGTKPITVEAWVKAPAGAKGTVVGSSQRAGCALYANGHFDVRQGRGGKTFTFAATDWMPKNRWYHLAATFDGESVEVFVDGKSVKGTVSSRGGYSAAPFSFKIGARPSGRGGTPEAFFTGLVDEVRISSVVRYQKEFSPTRVFQPDEHTLALYHFDEGSGNTAKDSSGNKHHGKIVGAKWIDDSNASASRSQLPKDIPADPVVFMTFDPEMIFEKDGKQFLRDRSGNDLHAHLSGFHELADSPVGKRIAFDGRGYAMIPNHPRLRGGANLTLSVAYWFHKETGAVVRKFASPNSKDWSLNATKGSLEFYGEEGNSDVRVNAPLAEMDSDWNHVAMVLDGRKGQVRFFLNGKIVLKKLLPPKASVATDARVAIAIYQVWPNQFQKPHPCRLDQLAIYDRVLSSDDVLALYKHSAAKFRSMDKSDQASPSFPATGTVEEKKTWVVAELKRLNPQFDRAPRFWVEEDRIVGFEIHDAPITDLAPLTYLTDLRSIDFMGCRNLADLSPLAELNLASLKVHYTGVKDLSPLKGMKLRSLWVGETPMWNLSPLSGMSLTYLYVRGSKVINLAPIKGMPLEGLNCAHTGVKDLSPVEGMPLKNIICDHTPIDDFVPLQSVPLVTLQCDFAPGRDAAILRQIKTLKTINGNPVGKVLALPVEKEDKPDEKSSSLREWTDKTGKFKVRAELVAVEGNVARLRKADGGKIVELALSRLSDVDQAVVKEWLAQKQPSG